MTWNFSLKQKQNMGLLTCCRADAAKLLLLLPSCHRRAPAVATAAKLPPQKKREEGVRREVGYCWLGCAVSAMKTYPQVL
jgi:hypothetical protein